ncbi:MAG: formimidoylglutamate deiminase, partial [Alphaproteobacteria bacterium]
AAAAGGAQALGRGTGRIETGAPADLLALDGAHPDLAGRSGDTILDSFVFAGGRAMVREVWAAGRHVVREGRHIARETLVAGYRRALADLTGAP